MAEVDEEPTQQQGELEVAVAEPMVCFPIAPWTAQELSLLVWKDRVDSS